MGQQLNFKFQHEQDSINSQKEKATIINHEKGKRKDFVFLSAMVIGTLLLCMALLLNNRQKLKSRKEREKLKYEKQITEAELSSVKKSMEEHIKTMEEKNTLLEQFKTNLEDLKSKEIDITRIKHLEYLREKTILTDEDWNKFRDLFDEVHKGFIIRLTIKIPELSQAEIRFLCLTKLKVGDKQMASILGISYNSIRQSRYVLRKKLNLSENTGLDNLVDSI